jgi:hypothetical protein
VRFLARFFWQKAAAVEAVEVAAADVMLRSLREGLCGAVEDQRGGGGWTRAPVGRRSRKFEALLVAVGGGLGEALPFERRRLEGER